MQKGGTREQGIQKKTKEGFPLISIVTVTFNGERFLKQALQSIVSQTYQNIELIIIDGGSTDRTLDIIREFEDRIDFWVSEPDGGIYDAMNRGILQASGDWIGFKNADDWYCDRAVLTLVENINRRPEVDVWYGNSYSVVQENPLRLAPFFTDHNSLGGNPGIDHRSSFVRLGLHRKILFDTRYRLAADFDVFWRLKKEGAVFAHLKSFISFKRYGGASDGTQILKESFRINQRHAGWVFALSSRFKSWSGYVVWKAGNTLLRFFLGKEGFLKFKERKIRKTGNSS
jgi:glycosyltransferase involved in cell wall biosynthesis